LTYSLIGQQTYFINSFGNELYSHPSQIIQLSADNYCLRQASSDASNSWNVGPAIINNNQIIDYFYDTLTITTIPNQQNLIFRGLNNIQMIDNEIFAIGAHGVHGFGLATSFIIRGNQNDWLQNEYDLSWTPNMIFRDLCVKSIEEQQIWSAGYAALIDNNEYFQFPYLNIIDYNTNTIVWDTVYNLNFINPYVRMNSSFNEIQSNKQGGIYALVNYEFENDFNLDNGGVLLCEIDSNGHWLWHHNINLGYGDVSIDFIKTNDEGYLINTRVGIYLFSDTAYTSLIKLNENRELDWQIDSIHIDTRLKSMLQNKDDSYIICGNAYHPNDDFLDGFVYKLSANGDSVLWYRRYGETYHEYIEDIIFTDADSTGLSGYTAVGRQDLAIPGSNIYLLKLNCMGLANDPTASFIYENVGQNNQVLFYNQSQHIYADSIDGGYYVWDFGDDNQLIQTTDSLPTINHQYETAGSYTVSITGYVCNDTVQYTENILVGPVGVNANLANEFNNFQISPNPSKGIFYISNNAINATIEIFNANGELVYTNETTTTKIDLSAKANGIYYYNIKTLGQVYSGKLIKN